MFYYKLLCLYSNSFIYYLNRMAYNKLLVLLLILSISIKIEAQNDSINVSKNNKAQLINKSVIPVILISSGLLLNGSDFEKEFKVNLRNLLGNDFELPIDNYIQYAPIAELYLADAIGIKSKNHWFDQTKYLLISNLITATITHTIKRTSGKIRPNNGSHSFPSGHTSFSFTNATVLYNEFKDTSPYLAYSGYLFSTTTGALRIANNKHWLSDVLVGAGIGILVTELVYHFEPLKNWNPFINSKNITLVPQFDNNKYGFYLSIRL